MNAMALTPVNSEESSEYSEPEIPEGQDATLNDVYHKLSELCDRVGELAAGNYRSNASVALPTLMQSEERLADRGRKAGRPPFPDSRLIRRIIRQRRLRDQFFGEDLFSDPAWDILLDLTAATAEQKRISVTSLCIAAAVPPTTALRWIGLLEDAGLVERVQDISDRRRAFVALTDRSIFAISAYFQEVVSMGI